MNESMEPESENWMLSFGNREDGCCHVQRITYHSFDTGLKQIMSIAQWRFMRISFLVIFPYTTSDLYNYLTTIKTTKENVFPSNQHRKTEEETFMNREYEI
jgi:hypothetical protein